MPAAPMRQRGDAQPQPGAHSAGRGRAGDAGGTRNIDRNGSTSALPRRSEASSVRPNLREGFDPHMVNFPEMRLFPSHSERSSSFQYRIGMALDFHVAPDARDM